MPDYFVLVHGHLCGHSCKGDDTCPEREALLTHISEIEERNPTPLFERQESEGPQDCHVLHSQVRALFERPRFKGQPRLRQDCVGEPHRLIWAVTRAEWTKRREEMTIAHEVMRRALPAEPTR